MLDAVASDATSCAAVVRRLPPATAIAITTVNTVATVEGIAMAVPDGNLRTKKKLEVFVFLSQRLYCWATGHFAPVLVEWSLGSSTGQCHGLCAPNPSTKARVRRSGAPSYDCFCPYGSLS